MSQKVRVRFAPSPTGPLHIGGVRTALFNYLFAKKHGGNFILRIEDTDQNRYVEGAEDYIKESLEWCNIPYDEGPGKDKGYGPYRQSERKHLYKEYADQLISSGHAYYAFDSAESLDAHRKSHEENGKTFIYNWHNREKLDNSLTMPKEEVEKRIAAEDYVIRFKSPQDETLYLDDEIRGEMTIDTNVLDDKVLFKSDGMPTYHLANIVDDHLMKITHVIRGEEWLPSLALHVLLYRSLGWDAPKFAHLPLIMKPQGKGKLSKRDGDKMGFPVFPLQWKDKDNNISAGYREDGYLPEAVINMLAFLGWNEGEGSEKQFYTLEELVEAFSLEHVSKSGAKFDPEKTKWFQHHYLQQVGNEDIALQFINYVNNSDKGISLSKDKDLAYITNIVSILKERCTFVSDLWEEGSFLFKTPNSYDEKAVKKAWKDQTGDIMTELAGVVSTIEDFTAENVQQEVKSWINSTDYGFGKVMQPFRLSLVGEMSGPDVFVIASLLGQDKTLERLRNAISTLS